MASPYSPSALPPCMGDPTDDPTDGNTATASPASDQLGALSRLFTKFRPKFTDIDCLIFCLLLPKPPLPVLYIYIISLIKKPRCEDPTACDSVDIPKLTG